MDTQCISCQYKKGMFVYNHQIISNFARDKKKMSEPYVYNGSDVSSG